MTSASFFDLLSFPHVAAPLLHDLVPILLFTSNVLCFFRPKDALKLLEFSPKTTVRLIIQ